MTLRMPALCSNAEGKRNALALNGFGKAGRPVFLAVSRSRYRRNFSEIHDLENTGFDLTPHRWPTGAS